MFICKPCLSRTNPGLADNIPENQFHTTTCDTCNKKTPCVQIAPEAIRKAKPQTLPSATKQSVTSNLPSAPLKFAKDKYQFLLIDWTESALHLCKTKQELITDIQRHVFELKHEDIEIYKLVQLPHKAEIKVEVGKE